MAALRDALRATPDNVPLRLYLANILRKNGSRRDAELIYREGLRLHPGHEKLKLGLAQCFYEDKRYREALVLVEDLPGAAGEATESLLDLQIRLLALTEQREQARNLYDRALARYPSLSETDLPEFFGWPLHKLPAPAPRAQDLLSASGPVMVPRSYSDESLDVYEADVDRPPLSFQDVAGLEELKEEIRMKIVYPGQHPRLYEAYGRKPGGAMLLYGPPGCGKTHLARAAAGELQAAFISIGINDVLDMWLGQSEKNLHDLFEQARIHRPSVLFIDEVDALGSSRHDQRLAGGRQLINQFLSELDGVDGDNEGVLILAATNAPWHLDAAFRRPGRFDRMLFVAPPDAAARRETFEILLRDKPLAEETLHLDRLAQKTSGFSSADLKAVVDLAVERKLKAAIRSGEAEPITGRDLLRSMRLVRPSIDEWFATVQESAGRANPGGMYDPVLRYLQRDSSRS